METKATDYAANEGGKQVSTADRTVEHDDYDKLEGKGENQLRLGVIYLQIG